MWSKTGKCAEGNLKGIVHSKIKVMSSFTHPHVVPNLYDSIFMLNSEEYILNNFEEPNSCWSPLTSIAVKEILWKWMGANNCLITSIIENIFYYVYVFHFWVNYPFKLKKAIHPKKVNTEEAILKNVSNCIFKYMVQNNNEAHCLFVFCIRKKAIQVRVHDNRIFHFKWTIPLFALPQEVN